MSPEAEILFKKPSCGILMRVPSIASLNMSSNLGRMARGELKCGRMARGELMWGNTLRCFRTGETKV